MWTYVFQNPKMKQMIKFSGKKQELRQETHQALNNQISEQLKQNRINLSQKMCSQCDSQLK